MAGYYGHSMSNNAVRAYENGEKPLSKWTKKDILSGINIMVKNQEIIVHFDVLLLKKVPVKVLKQKMLYCSSWHHTSEYYNKTDFYSINTSRISEFTEADIQRFVLQKVSKEEPKEEKWRCAFLEWSGTRRHPVATEYIEEGTVKGDWFIRTNGKKKKTSANGFRFIEKIG